MTCTRAQEFLARNQIEIAEQANATEDRRGEREAIALASECDRLMVARGKKVVTIDIKNKPPANEILAKHLLGPTGNLRAPTMLIGKTLLVGFHEEEFAKVLGAVA